MKMINDKRGPQCGISIQGGRLRHRRDGGHVMTVYLFKCRRTIIYDWAVLSMTAALMPVGTGLGSSTLLLNTCDIDSNSWIYTTIFFNQ